MSLKLVVCFGLVLFVVAAVWWLRPERKDIIRPAQSALEQSNRTPAQGPQ
ncbi:hypothetical protein GGD53_002282 [Rhizobium aethiopicum]|uniref:Uncharacterized protein n=1 Tax=Rhizobium aethiopicum TaxID=1138170 RepID=A0A7W6Q9T5_9HYPH|nr:hypothetical protein [Rhizobium aethiopicum]